MSSIRNHIGADRGDAQSLTKYDDENLGQSAAFGRFSDIPSDLMVIDLTIGKKQFSENLRRILYYGRTDLESMDYEEIDATLDAMSEWQVTLGHALAHVQYKMRLLEVDVEDEKARGYIKSEESIIKRKYKKIGRYTGDVLRVSESEKHLEFMRNKELSEEYRILIEAFVKYQKNETILKQTIKVLEQRTTSLQGISKRRFREQKGYTAD